MFTWHSLASIGCYMVMKDEPWVPWYMGGSNEGNIGEGFANMPFTPMSKGCYIFGLILLGKPLQ